MLKIVVADDEQIVLDGMKMVLESSGRDWIVAGTALDGVKGLEEIRKHKPDIVITDIKMPEMDGLEMSKIVREESPETVIFVFSGYAEFNLAQKAIGLGVYNYLLKPINYEEIYEALEKAQQLIAERKRFQFEQEGLKKKLKASIPVFKEEPTGDPNKQGFRHKTISEVLKYIEENFSKNISLKEAAERVYLNINYLSEIFKAETGENFIEYLKKYRVKKAIELLDRADLKIYHISEMVGYSDPKHFSQVFKEITGVSPKDYKTCGMGRP